MNYTADFLNIWRQSVIMFPEFEGKYSSKTQRERESLMSNLVFDLKEWEQKKTVLTVVKPSDDELFAKLRLFFSEALDYSTEQLDVIFSQDMIKATYQFLRAARFYDPELSFHDVFQACRNVWIMNGLQYIFNVPVSLSPSIFAYSMLYPYTDNYIDDATVSAAEKYNFSLRFAQRLKGIDIIAQNLQEAKIFRMVALIEEEWDRTCFPDIYKSLLDIHDAQTQSASLVSPNNDLDEATAFQICIDKGGASVVADGFLVMGELNQQQEEFLYAYGAYLQLLDDIQDVGNDLAENLHTWHGLQANKNRLEQALNKTWAAGQTVLEMIDQLNSDRSHVFKSLMKKSIDLFLIEAVIANDRYFSQEYIREFEKYSPFRFSFIKKRSGSITPYQNQFFENIERFAFTQTPDDSEFSFLKKESLLNEFQQADSQM